MDQIDLKIDEIDQQITSYQQMIAQLEENRCKLMIAKAILIKKETERKVQEERVLNEPIEVDHPNQCKRQTCEYCRKVRICLMCNERLFCGKFSNCEFCGRGARRLDHLTGSGFLIMTVIQDTPCLLLNKEKWGSRKEQIGDVGGRFDPDKDYTLFDTLVREVREESGLVYTNQQVDHLPYIILSDTDQKPTYVMYLIKYQIDGKEDLRPDHTIIPENAPIYMPIENINPKSSSWNDLSGESHPVSSRLKWALNKTMINHDRKISLLKFLQNEANNLGIVSQLREVLT